jgi:alkylation response protein AidB-like acyl-CoA dehydrogenase
MLLSDEQISLADAVRDWLAKRTDLAAARSDGAALAALYSADDVRAAADLGLTSLLRPAEGGTFADLAVVVEELGRAGSPLPLGQAALVARLLDQIGIGAAVSDAVADGTALAVAAAAEPGDAAISGLPGSDGTLTLAGRAPVVVGGLGAGWLLVSAALDHDHDDHAFALVPAASATRTARTTLDLSRDIAAVDVHGVTVPADDWARVGAGVAETLDQALAIIHILDAVGAAGRLLDMTVGYVKEREQFGRPVGSFQAVKHHAATMAVDIEAARLCGHDAARALDSGDLVVAGTAVAVAGSVAGTGTSRAASTALQLHGGMGFTWEHDLHLFLRRIKVDELVRGTPRQHREHLIATAG